MPITLVHRTDAGAGDLSSDYLRSLLREAGHECSYVTTVDDWESAVQQARDLVIVAGGDGTVAKVAMQMAGGDVPLVALPLGTANNIARHLGWHGPLGTLVQRLKTFVRRNVDIGVARGPWGERLFMEGVGAGSFAHVIGFTNTARGPLLDTPKDPAKKLERDRHLMNAFVTENASQEWTVTVDGEVIEGAFVIVEVLNCRFIGPNLDLSPSADPYDGLLDVVMIDEAHRDRMQRFMRAHIMGDVPRPALPMRRARKAVLRLDATRVHIDDNVWPSRGAPPTPAGAYFEVHLHVAPGNLPVLVPASEPGLRHA